MLTVEEDREVETSKLPSPDMGLLKIGKTATFAFEYDETIDGSPIRNEGLFLLNNPFLISY